MTAIAAALSRNQAFLATDSRLSTSAGAEDIACVDTGLEASKILVIPHVRCALAVMGCNAAAVVLRAIAFQSPPGSDVLDLAASLPDVARRVSGEAIARGAQQCLTFVLAGPTSAHEMKLFVFDVRIHAVACALEAGCYAWPIPASRTRMTAESSPAPATATESAPLSEDEPSAIRPNWAAHTQACIELIRENSREKPDSIGGRIVTCTITEFGMHQFWVD
jgi:hypothetical protein